MSAITVGILEDEKPQAQMVTDWLRDAGYDVFHCDTGDAFLAEMRDSAADMLILDWQLPDCEGIDILQQLRNSLKSTVPIVFATAKNSEEDIVRGLSMGADDYLIKPLRRAELLARLEALWRRSSAAAPEVLELGPVQLDVENHQAYVDGEEVKLTSTEFRLAVCVFENQGRLLSREFLLSEVWGVDAQIDTRTVDMHMSRIRKLLRINPTMGYLIKTVYRHGYRLEAL